MTIKRRLVISNVLMIVVPVLIATVVAVCCVGVIWITIAKGTGLGFEDSVDFYKASSGITEVASEGIKQENKKKQIATLDTLGEFLDNGAMSLIVTANGREFYKYGDGKISSEDMKLTKAAEMLGNEATLTSGERNMHVHSLRYQGVDYVIYIYNAQKELSYNHLETAIAIACVILAIAILLSILFTNRFLTRFVFRHIEEPLDMLVEGVTEISRGNLDYRLEHVANDEFKPVFVNFNDMAARLKESVERSRREEESRKELMASISHDLRTPLTSIHAYVEGLLDGVARTPQAQQRYLQTIKNRAEELEVMVARVLEYSRLEMSDSKLNIEDVKLDEYLSEEVAALAQDYDERGMTITCDTMPCVITADASELHRMFINIADNSLKYKTAQRGSLHIELRDKGDTCELSFTDDGPGVPEEALAKLFDVFYRTDASRNDREQGNGLGLAIVHKIVANMGGSVRAENAEDGGLSIIMELPKGGYVNA